MLDSLYQGKYQSHTCQESQPTDSVIRTDFSRANQSGPPSGSVGYGRTSYSLSACVFFSGIRFLSCEGMHMDAGKRALTRHLSLSLIC